MSLTNLLADLRLAEATWGKIELGRAGGAQFSGVRNCYLHVVTHGTLHLRMHGLSAPRELRRGRAIFVIAADGHGVLASPQAAGRDVEYFGLPSPPDHIGTIRLGDPSGEAIGTTLTGAFSIDMLTLARIRRLTPGAVWGKAILLSPKTGGEADSRHWLDEAPGPGGTEYLNRLADLLLLQAVRQQLASARRPSVAATRSRDLAPKLLAAIALMHRLPGNRWTLSSLAERANMSRSAFAAAFSEGMGEPPMQFLTRIRMERAAELIADTNLPLTQICASLGYQSIPSFSRLFKQWYGVPPARFRAHDRQPAADAPFRPGDHWALFS